MDTSIMIDQKEMIVGKEETKNINFKNNIACTSSYPYEHIWVCRVKIEHDVDPWWYKRNRPKRKSFLERIIKHQRTQTAYSDKFRLGLAYYVDKNQHNWA